MSFDASGSTSYSGLIDEYHWDFGDGTTATGATVNHSFDEGEYIVTLTVTDLSEQTPKFCAKSSMIYPVFS